MKKVFIALIAVVALMTSCTVVDNSEVGIKFKKFGLTDQGDLPLYNGGSAIPFIEMKKQ